jgi:4'-phosphopantetheinyl transferase
VHDRDRRDFAVAHALLRQSLSACGTLAPHDWTFAVGTHGKPSLTANLAAREGLAFNLAHTDGLVACCVARHADVGIDVEAITRRIDIDGIATRFFSPTETADLEQCADPIRPARFAELWTLKEAYIKALGDGLSYALDRFTVRFEDPAFLRFDAGADADWSQWSFALFAPTDRHRMAVAVRSRIERERTIEAIAMGALGSLPNGRIVPVRRERTVQGPR